MTTIDQFNAEHFRLYEQATRLAQEEAAIVERAAETSVSEQERVELSVTLAHVRTELRLTEGEQVKAVRLHRDAELAGATATLRKAAVR